MDAVLDESAPFLLDTENIFYAFGYRDSSVGSAELWRRERELQRYLGRASKSADSVSRGAEVLDSLLDWAERVAAVGVWPRESYGKADDPGVRQLKASAALAELEFVHVDVRYGKNEADDRIVKRAGALRLARTEDGHARHPVLVLASSDTDLITRAVLDPLAEAETDGLFALVILKPNEAASTVVNGTRLSEWTVSAGVPVAESPANGPVEHRVRCGFAHKIHHRHGDRRKREGTLRRAARAGADAPVPPAADPTNLRWAVRAAQIADAMGTDKLRRAVLVPDEPDGAAAKLLQSHVGDPETAQLAIEEIRNAAAKYAPPAEALGWRREKWKLFVVIALMLPSFAPRELRVIDDLSALGARAYAEHLGRLASQSGGEPT